MNKIEKGQARQKTLKSILDDVSNWDTSRLLKAIEEGFLKRDGTFSKSKLANQVGFDCKPDNFRQNKKTMQAPIQALEKIIKYKLLNEQEVKEPTNKAKGEIARANFLEYLESVGTINNPVPIQHNGRLYKKGLWAKYTDQDIELSLNTPNWFSKEPVKEALDTIDLCILNKDGIHTVDMSHDSISDDIDDSMTSSTIRKQKQKIKQLEEKLEVLTRSIKKYEVENNAVILENRKLKNEVSSRQMKLKLTAEAKSVH